MKKTMLEYAELYLSKGFSIIPVKTKRKKPAIRWKAYQLRKPTLDELKNWFVHKRGYGIGVVTGKISGTCILDFDSLEAYQEARRKGLTETPTVETSRGRHLYFKYIDGIRNFQCCGEFPGTDLRGDGGYVVAPPSIHPTGHRYEWVKGKSLEDLPLAELPEWAVADLGASHCPSRQHSNRKSLESNRKLWQRPFNDLFKGVDEGERNYAMTRIAGWMVSQGFDYEYNLGWMEKINQRNRPPLPRSEVRAILLSVMKAERRKIERLLEPKLRKFAPLWKKVKPIHGK